MKDINIVILNYFTKDDALNALNFLIKDLANCPYETQITLADNSANADGIKEVLAQNFPQVKYVDCGGNAGFGKGNNIGFKQTLARYYFTLNPDTRIPENTRVIERLVKFMDEHPKVGCVGPKIISHDESLQHSCYRFDLPSILIKPFKQINLDRKYKWIKKYADRLLMKDFDHNETRPVDWVQGSALLTRQEVVNITGWFDERYFMYLEDCDWCRNMWENGWPVYYVHDIVIAHAHTRESAKVPGVFYALIKNKLARAHVISWFKYMWKWRGSHKYFSV